MKRTSTFFCASENSKSDHEAEAQPSRRGLGTRIDGLAILGLLFLICFAPVAQSVELLDPVIGSGAETRLEGNNGTIRVEGARVSERRAPTFFVPEPQFARHLLFGSIACLYAGWMRRKRGHDRATIETILRPFNRRNPEVPATRFAFGPMQNTIAIGAALLIGVATNTANAQVPQDLSFSGRLVNGSGIALLKSK